MKYLAFDIGAREVKVSLANKLSGGLSVTKGQSFRNNLIKDEGHLLWPVEDIYSFIVSSIRENGPVDSISIDSLASDFVLLDENDKIIGGAVSYLDERTKRIAEYPNEAWIFERTGFHSRRNSTLYQLLALKEEEKALLERAVTLLFLPDYFNFLLTGVKKTSLSMALTSSLVNSSTLDWDDEIISSLGLRRDIFTEIHKDGEAVGFLKEEVEKEVGFGAEVILSGHDTSLAYVAADMDEDTIMLSVGGFARLGVYIDEFNLSDDVMHKNYTNAISPGGQKILTKYLMGTYLIQKLKDGMKEGTSYDEIMKKARAIHYPETIDISALDYEEKDVLSALNRELEKKGLGKIEDLFEAASLIYNSLASYYQKEIEDFEKVLGRSFTKIALVGGAGKDLYIGLLIAMKTKKTVVSGPVDAALVGNLVFQALCDGGIKAEEKDEEIKKALGRVTYKVVQ